MGLYNRVCLVHVRVKHDTQMHHGQNREKQYVK